MFLIFLKTWLIVLSNSIMWLFKSLSGQKEAKEDIEEFERNKTQTIEETLIVDTKPETVQTSKPVEPKVEPTPEPVLVEKKPAPEKIVEPTIEEQKNFVEEMTPDVSGKVSKTASLETLFKRYLSILNFFKFFKKQVTTKKKFWQKEFSYLLQILV
jgi:hypothetical protein